MDPASFRISASYAVPLWDSKPIDGAFTLDSPNDDNDPSTAILKFVFRPWLFQYAPAVPSNGRHILVLGGGGYVELMVGREGVQVAKWLCSLGFYAWVLVHRFPNAEVGAQAPVDDARQALRIIKSRCSDKGIGVVGLSSGGHLAASLLSHYPSQWTDKGKGTIPELEFAVIGYAPLSTNAVGRQIIPNKPAFAPPEKQELYNIVQPDVQLKDKVPPTFVVYAGNDPVVPVVNAYRLVGELGKRAGMNEAKMEAGKVELHVFADAPHGFALDADNSLSVSGWMRLFEAWMRQSGFLS